MEPIFENKTTLTDREQFIEIQWTIIRSGSFTDKFIILNLLLLALSLFFGICQGLFYMILIVVELIILDIITVFVVRHNIKKTYEMQKSLIIGVEKTTRFYENEVKTQSEKSALNVTYDEISKVISVEGYYIFIAGVHFFPVDKNGFTAGDKNMFERFIVGKITPKRFKNVSRHTNL